MEMIPGPVIAGVSNFVSWCFEETQNQHLWNAQKRCWGWTTAPTAAEMAGKPRQLPHIAPRAVVHRSQRVSVGGCLTASLGLREGSDVCVHTVWMGVGPGTRGSPFSLSPGSSAESRESALCVHARADHVSTWTGPLAAREVWPLRAGSLSPPRCPRSLLPGGYWRTVTPLTWITVSSPSWDRSAVSPSPGSLEEALIAGGTEPGTQKKAVGAGAWLGHLLQCPGTTPVQH